MRKAGLIQDNLIGRSKILKNSFKGEDFVQWIMKKKNLRRGEALCIGQRVVERYFTEDSIGSSFSSDKYYQLPVEDQSQPVNAFTYISPKNPRGKPITFNLAQFNTTLCSIVQPIYDEILSENKRCIYYDLLEENQGFQEYLSFVKNAAYLDIERASTREKLALFVNVHNMMVLHFTYKYGMPTNIWQRRKLAIKDGKPLVHFAVNNCTQSCPPLRTYSTENVYNEIKENARNCIQSEDFLQIDRKKRFIILARLFRQYSSDFGENQEDVIQWICDLFPDKSECKKSHMKMFLDGQYSVSYLPANSETNFIQGRNSK